MRAVFVMYGPLDVNSAIQAFHFGNEMTEQGWEVDAGGGRRPAADRGGRPSTLRVHLPRDAGGAG